MTPEDVWIQLYDKGINEGIEGFTHSQKCLYHYINFVYSVEMEGASGFLYNFSPSKAGDNEYQPFINSWRFFGYSELADLINNYNDLYLEAIEASQTNPSLDFDSNYHRYGLSDLKENIIQRVDDAASNNLKILDWVELNKEGLMQGIK